MPQKSSHSHRALARYRLPKKLGYASLAFILLFSATVNSQQRTSARQTQQPYQEGLELLNKGDLDGAIEAFKKAVTLRPKEAETHYYLGYALGIKGLLADAILELQRAISLNPELGEAHYYLGAARWFSKDIDGAIAALRAAV